MGTMRIMDGSGDTKLIWDSTKTEEVEAARKMFNDLKGKRYQAFGVKKTGEKGEMITSFDPYLEKIIMAPPLQGG